MDVEMPRPQVAERIARGRPGWPVLGASVVVIAGGVGLILTGVGALAGIGVALIDLAAVAMIGLTAVAPGQARVVQLLGRYAGTIRTDGLRWVNPLTTRRRVSTRIRNLEPDVAKVNDADGNPIEMAAVVVWQVEDSAKAVFVVDDFVDVVATQT